MQVWYITVPILSENVMTGLEEGVRLKERRSMEERLRDQEEDVRRRMEEIR
jgi:hypothetical protein